MVIKNRLGTYEVDIYEEFVKICGKNLCQKSVYENLVTLIALHLEWKRVPSKQPYYLLILMIRKGTSAAYFKEMKYSYPIVK